jgi:hypothetical protein
MDRRQPTHRALTLIFCVLLFLSITLVVPLTACTSPATSPTTSTTPPTSTTSITTTTSENIAQKVTELVNSIDPSKPDTLYAVEELKHLGRAAAPTLLDLIDSPKTISRWAAVCYFSKMAEVGDIPVLSKGLNDTNLSIRSIAAATLLRLGDNSGLAILTQAAQSDEVFFLSEPPVLLSEYANWVLDELNPKMSSLIPEATLVSFFHQTPSFLILPNDISVTLDKCIVEIELNLQFHGDKVTQALVDSWVNGIIQMWDNRTTTNCCKIHLTVNTLIGEGILYDYTQINVIGLLEGEEHRSSATLGSSKYADSLTGEWDTNDTPAVAAHEAGHLLGADDDYTADKDGGNYKKSDQAAKEEQDGSPDIMAQTGSGPDKDGNLHPPTAKTRHGDAILKAFDLTCTDSCCPPPKPPPPPPTTTTTPVQPIPTPTPTPIPISANMSFENTVPYVYMQVFLDLTGPAGESVTVTLTGPAVDSPATKTGIISENGTLRISWIIRMHGYYTASGTVGEQTFTAELMVGMEG